MSEATAGSDIQEEWRVLPEFPAYEVTVTGGIRKVDTKEPIETYMGRLTFDGPLHPRVRLIRNGVKYPNAMKDLIKSAFKTIPRSVLPKLRTKSTPVSNEKPKDVPLVDRQDLMAKEWRDIPGFPNYRITKDGDVRNRNTGKLITIGRNGRGTTFYTLWRRLEDGSHKTSSRSPKLLVWSAFPELKPEETPKKEPKVPGRKYIKTGEWRVIPGYPNLQLHETGAIRFSNSRKRLKFKVDHNGSEYLNLTNGDGHRHWLKVNLIAFVFPEKGVTFIPDSTEDPNWKIHPTYSGYEVNYEGQVRHRVRKQLLIANRYNLYAIRVSGHKYYWRKDRFFTDEQWDEFWNNDLEGQVAA